MNTTELPPNISEDDKVILFDGVCKLCNAWSNFIIQHDDRHVFKLCSVQSDEGKKILAHFGLPTEFYDTMLYVEGSQHYGQSDAFLNIVNHLDYPWKLARVFRFIPRPIRNWLYDRIALNRYRIFGKYDYCSLPMADHETRYVKEQ